MMRRITYALVLALSSWSLNAAEWIPKGSSNLLQDATLSQPFTVFDQLLVTLDRKASEVARTFRPMKNEFRPSKTALGQAMATVYYEKQLDRTAIMISIFVNGIDAPWQDICAKHIKDIRFQLDLPVNNDSAWETSSFGFFSPILGPRLITAPSFGPPKNDTYLEKYKAFSDSIALSLTFNVEREGGKGIKFVGECAQDNKTGKIFFREHRY